MSYNKEGENKPYIVMVHIVCWAGSDRSRYIAEELNRRGYVASHGGVLRNHNYTTEDDLRGVSHIIFTTQKVAEIFKKDKRLNCIVKKAGIQKHVIDITESEKQRARDSGDVSKLLRDIQEKLDALEFRDINSRKIGK